ncbi:MAG: CheY-like chemotaxis protein [Bacteroidia bacterium]|jgi:CheY-like chemotaxis protein
MNIALIDDNEIDIFVNTKLLETSSITANITSYLNPLVALDTLCENDIDLIIVDNQMPEINGYEFLEKIIASKQDRLPRMIVLTASVHTDLQIKYEGLHNDIKLWEKPLNVEALASLLAEA